MKHALLLVVGTLIAMPFLVQAGPIVRSGESVSVDASQSLEGDFYGLASSLTLSGAAKEDVYVVGGDVTINGDTAKDVLIIGGSVQVHGTVGDDLRVAGGDVTLAEPVKGDVVVLGGTLTILSTASVGGDVLFWGGKLVVEGAVAGAIHGGSDEIRVNAAVGKGIEYTARRSFMLGDNARISGDVVYTGYREVERAQGAVVENIRHIDKPLEDTRGIDSYVLMVLAVLFSALVCFFLARGFTERFSESTITTLGLSGLFGIAFLIVIPVIAVVLMVSVVGGVLGVLLIAGYVTFLLLALILSPFVWGLHVQRRVFKKQEFTLTTAVLGVALFLIILSLPLVGPFLVLATLMVSLGNLAHAFYHAMRA